MAETIFTQIINHEVPANIQYEDDLFIAFDDIHPSAPVHVLIIPKKPYPTLQDIPIGDDDIFAGLLKTARKVAEKLEIADNYRLVMNVGEEMQVVHHVHLHLMGGWSAQKLDEIRQTVI